jgi:LysM repeat protein
MSSALGENSDKTHAALHAAVPGLLGGFDRVASTADGARRLSSAIDETDDSILNNLTGMFGKSSSMESGTGILGSILGSSGLSDFSSNIRRSSGLGGRSISLMLGFLAPLVLGVIKRTMLTRGLAVSSIASLLASQRANIEAAMPRGMAEVAAAEPRREFAEETYTTPRSVPPPRMAETPERRAERSGRGWPSWILPLLLIAGALGLIWLLGNRPTVRAAREESKPIMGTTRPQDEYRLGRTSMEALKTKYASVLQEAQAQGVQLSTVRYENGKLVLRGTAPSMEAANKVWEEIKRINPSLDDISAHISVTPSAVPPRASSGPSSAAQSSSGGVENTPADSGAQSYTVKPGDTLGSISKQFYGNSKEYMRIFNANQDQIQNRNVLKIGQELTIPD